MRTLPLFAILLTVCCLLPGSGHAQELKCRPESHSFGNVQVGSTASFSFELTNIGTKTLTISAVSRRGAAFSLGDFPFPVKLRPGKSIALPVNFSPAAAAEDKGAVVITSNAPTPTVHLKLRGTGESATGSKELNVSPATLNFGNVTVGNSAALQTTLTASGGTVTITSDPTNSSEFAVSGITLPYQLKAGDSVQATVTFTPNASGTASATAGFISNAKDSPTSTALNGTGLTQSSYSADLSWEAGTEDIVGYNLYRGTTHGGPYSAINSALLAQTTYTDSTVASGNTYYYVATEVNNQGQESGYSTETKAVVP